MHANYQYSLTAAQQQAIQVFLRFMPAEVQDTEAWKLLHDLTYSMDWSEVPKYRIPSQPAGGKVNGQ